MLVDNRLRTIEKKMWTIAGSLTIISFHSISDWSKIFKRCVDSTTNFGYNTNKVTISIWISLIPSTLD